MIQQYNEVIDELCAANTGIMVNPPDFYSYFAQHYADEYADNIHPNGEGYKSMAQIWSNALISPEY
jgi:lysophospholipase L1-like esterase